MKYLLPHLFCDFAYFAIFDILSEVETLANKFYDKIIMSFMIK